MRKILLAEFSSGFFALLSAAAPANSAALRYPDAATVDQVDVYHGVEVHDPYRWLEADVRESGAVAAWVEAQNKVAFAYLQSLPQRDAIRERLRELWDYEEYKSAFKKGGRYFYHRNDGLQNHSVLYTMRRLQDEPVVLIDPNLWAEDGSLALDGTIVSDDGRYLAYGIQEKGSDWRVATGWTTTAPRKPRRVSRTPGLLALSQSGAWSGVPCHAHHNRRHG